MVRHSALFDKFADLEIPDNVYNWLVQFFQGHSHCTRYGHALREISASIVQGSAIGPASYVVTASVLTVPRSCTASFGLRSFGSSGPTAWNDMPAHLRNLDLSLSDFRQLLKTALFQTVPV